MADERDPLEPAGEPEPETPDETPEDTAPDAADATETNWKARYDEAQKHIGRQARELGVLRQSKAETPEGNPPDASDGSYLEVQNQTLADELYGEPVVAAYDAAAPLLTTAQTQADWYAALEAYHEARSNGAKAPEAAAEGDAEPGEGKLTREQALRPRTDQNRSDSPDSDKPSEDGKSLLEVVTGRWGRRGG